MSLLGWLRQHVRGSRTITKKHELLIENYGTDGVKFFWGGEQILAGYKVSLGDDVHVKVNTELEYPAPWLI